MASKCRTVGDVCSATALSAEKARVLADALTAGQIQYAKLVDCRQVGTRSAVTLDVEVEVPQVPIHPIARRERVVAIFDPKDAVVPTILALRQGFPVVPHLNLQPEGEPPSLCLYDEPYHELKRRWTPQRFVERIRQWLADTAKGQLHQDDQPLEPLLLTHSGHIVLPHDLALARPELLYVRGCSMPPHQYFLIATRDPPDEHTKTCPVVTSVHVARPQCHGLIRCTPTDLASLACFCEEGGLDLIGELRSRLAGWFSDANKKAPMLDAHLAIVLILPKTRRSDGAVESTETRAFICDQIISTVGAEIGVWTMLSGTPGLIMGYDDSKKGELIPVSLLNPCYQLSRRDAAALNGLTASMETTIAAIGVGALGSQVVMNCARCAFGRWTLIDPDWLFPHNVARHLLTGFYVGSPKAVAVAHQANAIVERESFITPLAADVLHSNSNKDVGDALERAGIILDMSASVGVARHITHRVNSAARRVSLFLTPTGDDLVFLAEDTARQSRLDGLEMQYYRAVATEPDLASHFSPVQGRQRYGQTCRDVTSTLPHDRVALHAAIASRALRDAAENPQAQIAIWRAKADGSVRRVDVQNPLAIRHAIGDWVFWSDMRLIDRLATLRQGKLPNETGGVLIGSMDLDTKTVYVVDTIPSPPDSVEWPTLYIRGCRGLRSLVDQMTNRRGITRFR